MAATSGGCGAWRAATVAKRRRAGRRRRGRRSGTGIGIERVGCGGKEGQAAATRVQFTHDDVFQQGRSGRGRSGRRRGRRSPAAPGGRAQASVAASGTTSSTSPWMHDACRPAPAAPPASRSTGRPAPAGAAARASGSRVGDGWRRRSRRTRSRPAAAAARRTRGRARARRRRARRRPRRGPRPRLPSSAPMPRKLKRTLRPAELQEGARDRLHDLVVERAAELRMRMADDRDAARRRRRRSRSRTRCARPGRRSARDACAGSWRDGAQRPTSGGSSRRSTTSPLLQVRVDDLVDVAARRRRCTRRLRDRPPRPARRRSGPGSPALLTRTWPGPAEPLLLDPRLAVVEARLGAVVGAASSRRSRGR